MKNCFSLILCLLFILPLHAQSDGIPLCPAEVLCRIDQIWTASEIENALGSIEAGEGAFFRDDETLVFVFRSTSQNTYKVAVEYAGVTEMLPVEDSDLWTLSFELERADEAIFSIGLVESAYGSTSFRYPFASWRGDSLPPPPAVNEPIEGSLTTIPFDSPSLGESRNIYLYLPPNHNPEESYPVVYMADGIMLEGYEGAASYAGAIDYLITSENIPPLIVVGIDSGTMVNDVNVRGEEYVHGRNPERYAKHEIFFTQEVREWAEANYGASTERSERIIFGVSNGGLYAVAMGIAHPDLYGVIFPFSAGAGLGFEPLALEGLELPLFVYSTAGTLDPIFLQTTTEFAQAYEALGAETVFVERVAGHDDMMWREEFINALLWHFQR